MSIYALKPKFQALLRPLVNRLASKGVTANQVTLAACAISLCVGGLACWAVSLGGLVFLWLLPIWFFLRMAFNAIDGMLAREHQQQSALGGYLNELTDVISDTALYLPILFVAMINPWLVWAIVFLAVVSEFAGVLGQVHGNGRRYEGPMGKSDRAFAVSLVALLVFFYPDAQLQINGLLLLINLMLALTIYRRIKAGLAGKE